MMTEDLMAKPMLLDIKLNIIVLNISLIEKPRLVGFVVTFFQGAKSVRISTDTEKKYGRKIKIFFRASKKF